MQAWELPLLRPLRLLTDVGGEGSSERQCCSWKHPVSAKAALLKIARGKRVLCFDSHGVSKLWRHATESVCSAAVLEPPLRWNTPIVTYGSVSRAPICGATNTVVEKESYNVSTAMAYRSCGDTRPRAFVALQFLNRFCVETSPL